MGSPQKVLLFYVNADGPAYRPNEVLSVCHRGCSGPVLLDDWWQPKVRGRALAASRTSLPLLERARWWGWGAELESGAGAGARGRGTALDK